MSSASRRFASGGSVAGSSTVTLLGMSDTVSALTQLASQPEVSASVDAARDACTQLRWHNALRRRTPEAAAESRVRGARASAALEGAEVAVDVVRELMVGATAWPAQPGPLELTLRGAVHVTAEIEHVTSSVLTAPAQALARLHTAAAADLVEPAQVGRPRVGGEGAAEFSDLGPCVPASELPARLGLITDVVAAHKRVPVPVVAAIVHAEIMVIRPFVRGNALVARALERALIKAAGLDPTGVVVPEVGYLREASAGYIGALAAYASGSAQGVGLWLEFSAQAISRGAAEGVRIADAVQAGSLRIN